VGGAKVSSKLTLLQSLARVADGLIVGGGIANTFLAAAGHAVGASLHEPDLIESARSIHTDIEARGGRLQLPIDVVTATEVAPEAQPEMRSLERVEADGMIVDVGPQTRAMFEHLLSNAGTIVWNGPVGVFEIEQFGDGTRALASAIAGSDAFSVAGGGDTLAAIEKYGIESQLSYISTGGGAFLEFLAGKTLPAIAVLQERAQ